MKTVLEKIVTKYPSKAAIVYKDQSITFAQLHACAVKLASALAALGVKKGDKIGIYLPNMPQCVYSYLSTFYLGAVGVPLDYMLKTDELVSCLGHAEVKFLIALYKKDLDLPELKKQIPSLKNIIVVGEKVDGCLCFDDVMASGKEAAPAVELKDSDPALIMYTSGTTGRPKGILLNYKHLQGSPEAMHHFVDLTDKDIKLCAIPLSHIGGFIYLQNCLTFGITVILMDRFHPFEFLTNIQKYKVTCFHIVPPMYNALLTMKQIENVDLSSLRWVVVFGAPSSPEMMERFHKYCPNAKLLNGWGMTETCPPNTVTPLNSMNIASVGKPAPNCKIKVIDDNHKEVSTGEIGEVAISGWIVMDEYYKDPQATAEAKQNGWLLTGDLGKFDKEGFLYIVGRKKEMIKVAGQIVFAPEVEATFYKNEAVAEVAVIGVPDKLKGEAVKAYVVLKEGAALSIEDLRYFAREHLANFKVPQQIEVRKELPKNRTGKIDKQYLQNETLAKA